MSALWAPPFWTPLLETPGFQLNNARRFAVFCFVFPDMRSSGCSPIFLKKYVVQAASALKFASCIERKRILAALVQIPPLYRALRTRLNSPRTQPVRRVNRQGYLQLLKPINELNHPGADSIKNWIEFGFNFNLDSNFVPQNSPIPNNKTCYDPRGALRALTVALKEV